VVAVVGTQERHWVLRGEREACWLAWLMQGGGYGYEVTRLRGYEGGDVQGCGDTVAGRDV
jgi:hypothetical protein